MERVKKKKNYKLKKSNVRTKKKQQSDQQSKKDMYKQFIKRPIKFSDLLKL